MTDKQRRIIAHLAAILTGCIWGVTFVSTKVLLSYGLSPAQIFTLRFVLAYIIIVCVSIKRREPLFCPNLKEELRMIGLGITGGSIYFLAENLALSYSTATNVSLIVCSCPLFTTLLFCVIKPHFHLTRKQCVGTLFAFVGMAIVVLNGQFVLHLSPIGDALAFVACLSWVIYSYLQPNPNDSEKKYSTLLLTRKTFFYGILTILPYLAIENHPISMQTLLKPTVAANLVFLGVVASLICYLVWAWCIKQIGAVATTNYVYFDPITTVVAAALILHEPVTIYFLIGATLIIIGLMLAYRKNN